MERRDSQKAEAIGIRTGMSLPVAPPVARPGAGLFFVLFYYYIKLCSYWIHIR